MSLLCGGAPPALEILTLDPYSPCLSWLRIAALKPDTALRDWGDVSGRKVDSLGLGGGIPVDSIASQDSLIDVETLLWKQKMHERDLEAQAEAISALEASTRSLHQGGQPETQGALGWCQAMLLRYLWLWLREPWAGWHRHQALPLPLYPLAWAHQAFPGAEFRCQGPSAPDPAVCQPVMESNSTWSLS